MVKLALLDYDNTLYSHQTGSVPAGTREALEMLRKAGAKLVLSTGRGRGMVDKAALELVRPSYLICADGMLIEDEGGRILYSRTVPFETVRRMSEYCVKRSLSVLWKYADYLTVLEVDRLSPEVYDYGGVCRRIDLGSLGSLESEPCYGAAVIGADEEKARELKERFAEFSFHSFSPSGLDVCFRGVDKGTACAFLRGYLGLRREEVLAAGDSENDAAMLREAGIGIAVGNGEQAAKDAADYVTDSIEEEGFLHAVENVLSGKWAAGE